MLQRDRDWGIIARQDLPSPVNHTVSHSDKAVKENDVEAMVQKQDSNIPLKIELDK